MATATTQPKATDLLSVRSRVSWGAIAAGAMVALSIYILLSLLGVALGIEAAARGADAHFGAGAAIYSILTLLIAMFFGGWATSRLAVGESKLEAVLYGLILWGVLFIGMIWLLSAGIRTGFGGMIGLASGVYMTQEGGINMDRIASDLKQAGVEQATIDKYRDYYQRLKDHPESATDISREASNDPNLRRAGAVAGERAREATWWTLLGVVISMATVIVGSLMGSGELFQPVPLLGVRRPPGLVTRA